uniref:JmjC domain-containing protein n=1 Tax=Panagrolaimus sp. PS1159 TaxID=55785 RepID=A0AC35GX04_9BILA
SAMDSAAKSNPDFPVGWNMHNLPGKLTELLQDSLPIYGVSTAMCYAGELATWSMAHVENGDMLSANLLLKFSAGKAWTGYNPSEEKKINPFLATGPRKKCISPLLHVDIMFDNELYDDKEMQWYYCIQRPGDIVITNPMGVHQVHNLGYNIAEATNFISRDYRCIARRRKACQCPGRLTLYKDFEQWNTLAHFVYDGELEILEATFATANLPAEDVREMYRTIPSQNPWAQMEDSEEEMEPDLGDVVVTPMESLNNVVNAVINNQNEAHDQQDSVDLFADENEESEHLNENEPVEEIQLFKANEPVQQPHPMEQSQPMQESQPMEQSQPMQESQPMEQSQPMQESQPMQGSQPVEDVCSSSQDPNPRINQRARDDAIIAAAYNAIKNMNNATQRQIRADARADWLSQRQRQAGSSYHPRERERSPRTRADEIRANKRITDTFKESRENARNSYEERNPGRNEYRIRDSGPVNIWFKGKLQDCREVIKRAKPRIEEFKATGKWFRKINFSQNMANAEAKIEMLHRRRLLFNALVKMYHHCPRVLQERIEEGYYEKDVIRDFIMYNNVQHRDLLSAALESLNADMEYWNRIFASEDLWNEEFGVDKHYRIPSLDWCTKNF